jgi:hypothetical protein
MVAKEISNRSLGPSGLGSVNAPTSPETQYVDLLYEPDPSRAAERERLGLLGRLGAGFSLFEFYSRAPSSEEFRACIAKLIAVWQGRARDARNEQRRQEVPTRSAAPAEPFLWIIAAGTPETLITKLKLERAAAWPTGVYLAGDDVLRTGIVVANELPRDPSTLLVRLMAAGPLLAHAVDELRTLPPDAHERAIAEPVLLSLEQSLGRQPTRTPEEQEFMMIMQRSWEDARSEGRLQGQQEGRAEGRQEGHAEGMASALLKMLEGRGIAVAAADRETILAQRDIEQLDRWFQRAIGATSLAEVFHDGR